MANVAPVECLNVSQIHVCFTYTINLNTGSDIVNCGIDECCSHCYMLGLAMEANASVHTKHTSL